MGLFSSLGQLHPLVLPNILVSYITECGHERKQLREPCCRTSGRKPRGCRALLPGNVAVFDGLIGDSAPHFSNPSLCCFLSISPETHFVFILKTQQTTSLLDSAPASGCHPVSLLPCSCFLGECLPTYFSAPVIRLPPSPLRANAPAPGAT